MNAPKTFNDIQDIVIPMVNQMVIDGIIKDCTDTDAEDEFMAQEVIGKGIAKQFGLDWEKLQE